MWARLQGVSFLTDDEKRAAIGYGPMPQPPMEMPAASELMEQDPGPFDDGAGKFNPHWASQPRHPRGTDEAGQWADGGGRGGNGQVHLAQARGGRVGGRGKPPATAEEERRVRNETDERINSGLSKEKLFNNIAAEARVAKRQLEKIDPQWRGPVSALDPDNIDGKTKHLQAWTAAAQARIKQLSEIPDTNIAWGADRLRNELRDRGGSFERQTDSPGWLLKKLNWRGSKNYEKTIDCALVGSPRKTSK